MVWKMIDIPIIPYVLHSKIKKGNNSCNYWPLEELCFLQGRAEYGSSAMNGMENIGYSLFSLMLHSKIKKGNNSYNYRPFE